MPAPIRHVQILVNDTTSEGGDGAIHAQRLARGLGELGLRVSLLTTDPPPATHSDFAEIRTLDSKRSFPRARRRPLGSIAAWCRALRRNAQSIDATIALDVEPAIAARLVRRGQPRLFVPSDRGRPARASANVRQCAYLERCAMTGASGLLVACAADRHAVAHVAGIRGVPIGMASVGVDVARAALYLLRHRAPIEIPPPRTEVARLSVVIPTFNRADRVRQAIDSVLRQTVAERCDIVVVDDGSTDETPAVLAAYNDRIHVLRQANGGPSAARNAGARHLPNAFVAFLDDDDVWRSTMAERLLMTWQRWPEAVLVTGRSIRRSADGNAVDPPPPVAMNAPADFAPALFVDNFLHTPAVGVRRDTLLDVGGFPLQWNNGEDFHLWIRLACRGPGVYLDEVLSEYDADTPNSLSKQDLSARASRVAIRRALRGELVRRPDCRPAARRGYLHHLRSWRDGCAAAGHVGAAWCSACQAAWLAGGRLRRWEWGQLLRLTARLVLRRPRRLPTPPQRVPAARA